MAQGAFWNTFVFAARARTLWDMARHTMPDICSAFEAIRLMLSSAYAPLFIEHAYQNMRSANFSSEVLSPLASKLRVMKVPEVGWSDWGSVERILASAKEMGRLPEIAARLKDRNISDPVTKAVVARLLKGFDGKRLSYSKQSDHARPVHADA